MEIKEITDKKIWDDFIKQNSPFSFFQSWDWGEVEKKLGKKVWRIGLFNIKNQKLKIKTKSDLVKIQNSKQKVKLLLGVSQIIKITAKRGSFLHVRHGPVFKNWDEKIITRWLNWIKTLADREKVSFVRISPRVKAHHDKTLQRLQTLGFRDAPIHNMDAETSYVVDLGKSENEILAGMRKTTRNLIRKAGKINIKIVKSKSEKDLNKFFKIFQETARRSGFVADREIKEEFSVFKKNDNVIILLAGYEDQIIAGAMILFSYQQAIYHYAASSAKMRNIPGSYLIQWEAIKEAKKRGLRCYNLWGGVSSLEDSSHPWHGLTMFKSGFGGEIMVNIHAQDLPLSNFYYLTYLAEKMIKYIRGYEKFAGFRSPSWLRRLIGV